MLQFMRQIAEIIAAASVTAAIAEKGYEPDSPTASTSTDTKPPTPTIGFGL